TFSANASDDSGVERVEFYANSSLLATDSIAPYSVSAMLPAGTYVVTAKAFDGAGASGVSGAVTVRVREATTQSPAFTSIARTGNSIMLTASGATGVSHTLQASSDLVNWSAIDTRTPVNGTITFTDTATELKRFYRVIAQ